MKKVILSLSLVAAVLVVSCKNEVKSDTKVASENTESTETTEKREDNTSTKSTSEVPSFSDEKVQEYVNAYEAYIEDYKKAVESKDMTAFASLGEKGQNLGTKAQEVMGNLSAEDVKKLSDYMQKKSAQLQELSKKMMQ